jgi:hypothetical protein
MQNVYIYIYISVYIIKCQCASQLAFVTFV